MLWTGFHLGLCWLGPESVKKKKKKVKRRPYCFVLYLCSYLHSILFPSLHTFNNQNQFSTPAGPDLGWMVAVSCAIKTCWFHGDPSQRCCRHQPLWRLLSKWWKKNGNSTTWSAHMVWCYFSRRIRILHTRSGRKTDHEIGGRGEVRVSFPFYTTQTIQIWLLWPSVYSCRDTTNNKKVWGEPTLSIITGFRLEQDSVRAGLTVYQISAFQI